MNDIQTESADGFQPRIVALADLRESPWNPRQYYPESAMAELTESMRQSGFRSWLPIVARPIGGGSVEDGLFEIAAGHRRSRAARDAGIEFVPCIVREMSDIEFLDILNFDNCGREDVHPLHEAAGWVAWMEKTGHGVLDIAARIGQSREYVYQRLKYSALTAEAAKSFFENKITAGHAILIARLQASDQKKALKFCEPPVHSPDQRPSVRSLAGYIQRDVHLDMQSAAFDLDSVDLLPAAGSCALCPKRTKNSPDLSLDGVAGDVYEDDEDAPDECTDPGCFNSKLSTHIVRLKDIMKTSGRELVEVSAGYGKAKKGVLSHNDYSEVAETASGSKPAIVMDGARAGEVIHVKVSLPNAAPEADAAKVREERSRQKLSEAVARERTVRLKLLEAIGSKVTSTSFNRNDLEKLVVPRISPRNSLILCRLHGIEVPEPTGPGFDWQAGESAQKQLVGWVPSMSEVEFFRLAFEALVSDDLDHWAIERQEPCSEIFALARRFKVDAVKIRAGIEEPSKASEGGTRREVGKKPDSPAKATPVKKAKAPAKPANPKTPAKTAPAKKQAPKKKAAARKKK